MTIRTTPFSAHALATLDRTRRIVLLAAGLAVLSSCAASDGTNKAEAEQNDEPAAEVATSDSDSATHSDSDDAAAEATSDSDNAAAESDEARSGAKLGSRLACDLVTETEVSELTGFAMTAESIDLGSPSLGSNCNFDGSEGRVRIAVIEPERGARSRLDDAAKFADAADLEIMEVAGYGDYAQEVDGTLQVAVGGLVLQAFVERNVDMTVAYDVMSIMIENL